jgi:hypothetical protein
MWFHVRVILLHLQTRRTKAIIANRAPLTELQEEFRPPEWLTATVPRKSPYFPQMADEVMYFHQGHMQYLKEVIERKVYPVNLKKGQPWHKIPNLRVRAFAVIVCNLLFRSFAGGGTCQGHWCAL